MRWILPWLVLGLSARLAAAEPTKLEKLQLTIDFPGTLEVFDTDVTGKEKLPATEVRIETSVADIGTVHIEQKMMDARPESREARDTIVAAFKSVRPSQ